LLRRQRLRRPNRAHPDQPVQLRRGTAPPAHQLETACLTIRLSPSAFATCAPGWRTHLGSISTHSACGSPASRPRPRSSAEQPRWSRGRPR